jgi:hypothetical protein
MAPGLGELQRAGFEILFWYTAAIQGFIAASCCTAAEDRLLPLRAAHLYRTKKRRAP